MMRYDINEYLKPRSNENEGYINVYYEEYNVKIRGNLTNSN